MWQSTVANQPTVGFWTAANGSQYPMVVSSGISVPEKPDPGQNGVRPSAESTDERGVVHGQAALHLRLRLKNACLLAASFADAGIAAVIDDIVIGSRVEHRLEDMRGQQGPRNIPPGHRPFGFGSVANSGGHSGTLLRALSANAKCIKMLTCPRPHH
jgi:hypothetical protein